MLSLSSFRIVRFVLAPLLILWVAGAGCLLGCEGMIATAAAAAVGQNATAAPQSDHHSKIVVSGHACSSGGSASSSVEANDAYNCCKKSSTDVEPQDQGVSTGAANLIHSGASSSGMMKDCPLAGSKAVVVTKSRSGAASASPVAAHSYLPTQDFLEQPAPLSTSPLIPNRGHTYLRCCVFLI